MKSYYVRLSVECKRLIVECIRGGSIDTSEDLFTNLIGFSDNVVMQLNLRR